MNKRILINVGRQFGSGGRAVALRLGSKLAIPVYDNELILKAAVESGFSAELLRQSDEQTTFFKMGFSAGSLGDTEVFKIQSNVIRGIAESGSAVFVGRASDYVLRDMKCLDVFVTAPLDSRKERICQRMGVSPEEAESLISKKDRTRSSYYNFFTFGHWGVASNYDLCVDSSVLGIEKTADLIIEFGSMAGLI